MNDTILYINIILTCLLSLPIVVYTLYTYKNKTEITLTDILVIAFHLFSIYFTWTIIQ